MEDVLKVSYAPLDRCCKRHHLIINRTTSLTLDQNMMLLFVVVPKILFERNPLRKYHVFVYYTFFNNNIVQHSTIT